MSAEVTTRLLPPAVLVPALVLSAFAVLILYRRDRRVAGTLWGLVLAGLRLAFVILVVTLLADPVLVTREPVVEPGEAVLVVDASQSFAIRDLDGSSRRELTLRALGDGFLERLRASHRLSAFSLGEELRPLVPEGDSTRDLLGAIPPAGEPQTRLDLAFSPELARRGGDSISGVILLTDGNHRGPADPAEAAASWASTGIPFVAVGVGTLSRPPDVTIEKVDGPTKAFAGDEVKAEVVLRSSGLPALDGKVLLSEDGERVTEVAVSLPQDGTARATMRFPAGSPGRRKVTFSVPPPPGEILTQNNARDHWIEVLSEKARVLYLDRGPRWEERYLRAVWSRDDNVELRAFRVSAQPESQLPQDFPRGRDALFGHDVVVLGDVGPELFAVDEQAFLRDFVAAHGGTLVLLCGEEAMPYAWTGTPIEEVLPVSLLRPAPPPGAAAVAGRDGLPLALTDLGEASEITRLVPGREANVELWGLLPGPYWASPIGGLARGAETLVRIEPTAALRLPWIGVASGPRDPEELDPVARRILEERSAVVVTGVRGAGRVLFVGSDSTWRWRYGLGDELPRRFWGQVIRWAVASRLHTGDSNVRLGTDRAIYDAASGIVLEAFVSTAPGIPFEGDLVDAIFRRLSDGETGRARLTPLPRSGGRYRLVADLEALGIPPRLEAGAPTEYEVRLSVPDIPGYDEKPDRAAARFAVRVPADAEALDLTCDAEQLASLAQAARGTYLPLSRLREAEGLLRDGRQSRERVAESRPWDHPLWVAVLLLGLLAAEWVLRKRKELV